MNVDSICSLGSSLNIFSSFLFFRFLVKSVNINRNQKQTTDTFDVVLQWATLVTHHLYEGHLESS